MRSSVPFPRRSLVACICLAGIVPASAASLGPLVTEEEVRLEMAAPRPRQLRAMSDPLDPRIEVQLPDTSHVLARPVSFRVIFQPAAGAAIVVSSFHATYGFLGIDITSRLLQRARLSATELVADAVDIPRGQHRVTLEIADSLGRKGRRTFVFEVA